MWKRIVLCVLVLLLSFGGTLVAGKMLQQQNVQKDEGTIINVSANPRTRSIYTSKDVYKEGEPILVTVTTFNPLDRVMVYRDGEFTDRMAYWRVGALRDGESETLLGAGSGNATNVFDHMESNYEGSGDPTFTPGRYAIVLMEYTGSFNSAALKFIYFTVIE